jgi:hypothetical protein
MEQQAPPSPAKHFRVRGLGGEVVFDGRVEGL